MHLQDYANIAGIISGVFGLISIIISLVTLSKVTSISNKINTTISGTNIQGSRNSVAGRDIKS